jgi:hypothetical protein
LYKKVLIQPLSFFNKLLPVFKKNLILIVLVIFTSCEKHKPLVFTEEIITPRTQATIELVYPKFEENSKLATTLNKTIKQSIAERLVDTDESVLSMKEAIEKFDTDYKRFIKDFQESQIPWEALVDSEITYQSQDIICIALNTYINTGGAHGNAFIEFLNFNAETGALLSQDDFLTNRKELTQVAKTHFIKMLKEESKDLSLGNYFNEDIFKLPEQIGFSDEGLILLYNSYEVLSNPQGITEFTIPFSEVESFLKRF